MDTPGGRSLYRLLPSTPSIAAIASGSWRTPPAREPGIRPERLVDKDGNRPEHLNQRLYDKDTGRLCEWGLSQQVAMTPEPWPTPNVCGGGNNCELTPHRGHYLRPSGEKAHLGLDQAVRLRQDTPWPTPRHEGFDAGGHRGTNDSLHSAVKAQPWGTPTARDWKDGSSVANVPENGLPGRQVVNRPLPTPTVGDSFNARNATSTRSNPDSKHHAGTTLSDTVHHYREQGLKLHGRWTLALMAFPPDWCDDLPPDPLGTTPM